MTPAASASALRSASNESKASADSAMAIARKLFQSSEPSPVVHHPEEAADLVACCHSSLADGRGCRPHQCRHASWDEYVRCGKQESELGPAEDGSTRNDLWPAVEPVLAWPRPSGAAKCRQQLARFGLQDGNQITRPDVGLVFKLLLFGQSAFRAAICQFVNARLELGDLPAVGRACGPLQESDSR